MIRSIVTIGAGIAVVLGVMHGNSVAVVAGVVVLALVAISCRFSARGGEW